VLPLIAFGSELRPNLGGEHKIYYEK